MEHLRPGTFHFVVSSDKGYQHGFTNRSSIIAMIEDERTERVKVMRDGKGVKEYKSLKWAAKLAKFVASGAYDFVFVMKKGAQHG